jgi:hypothetical protein
MCTYVKFFIYSFFNTFQTDTANNHSKWHDLAKKAKFFVIKQTEIKSLFQNHSFHSIRLYKTYCLYSTYLEITSFFSRKLAKYIQYMFFGLKGWWRFSDYLIKKIAILNSYYFWMPTKTFYIRHTCGALLC